MRIKKITVEGLWKRASVEWHLGRKVNVLSGINGSGKSTILQSMAHMLSGGKLGHEIGSKIEKMTVTLHDGHVIAYRHYQGNISQLKARATNDSGVGDFVRFLENQETEETLRDIHIQYNGSTIAVYKDGNKVKPDDFLKTIALSFVSTFDFAAPKPQDPEKFVDLFIRKDMSELDLHLMRMIEDYRSYRIELVTKLGRLISENKSVKSKAEQLFKSLTVFQDTVDEFFAVNRKKIDRDSGELQIIFLADNNTSHPVSDLSAGEKQLLLLFITAFLQQQREAVFLLDEPEISLHTDWQRKLISALLQLNPNAQIIVSTHSPAMILNEWQGSVVNISDLATNI